MKKSCMAINIDSYFLQCRKKNKIKFTWICMSKELNCWHESVCQTNKFRRLNCKIFITSFVKNFFVKKEFLYVIPINRARGLAQAIKQPGYFVCTPRFFIYYKFIFGHKNNSYQFFFYFRKRCGMLGNIWKLVFKLKCSKW